MRQLMAFRAMAQFATNVILGWVDDDSRDVLLRRVQEITDTWYGRRP